MSRKKIEELLNIDENLGVFEKEKGNDNLNNLYIPFSKIKPFFCSYEEFRTFKYTLLKKYSDIKLLNNLGETSLPITILLTEAISAIKKTKLTEEKRKISQKKFNDKKRDKSKNNNN